MLYWAGVVAVGGLVFLGFSHANGHTGPHSIGAYVFYLAFAIALLMAITHWLCKRNDWK